MVFQGKKKMYGKNKFSKHRFKTKLSRFLTLGLLMIQIYYKDTVLEQGQIYRSMEQNRKSRNKPTYTRSTGF